MPSIVIGIPGLWQTPAHAISALQEQRLRWTDLDRSKSALTDCTDWSELTSQVVDEERGGAMTVEIYPPSEQLVWSYNIMSGGKLSQKLLRDIERHTMTLYLVTDEAPGESTAAKAMRFAAKVLRAGGLSTKSECSGAVKSADEFLVWCEASERGLTRLAALRSLAVLVHDPTTARTGTYSAGLHQLGCRDTVVADCGTTGIEALNILCEYLVLSQPEIADGDTFTPEGIGRRFTLKMEEDTIFEEDHLYRNPFGRWRLLPHQQGLWSTIKKTFR